MDRWPNTRMILRVLDKLMQRHDAPSTHNNDPAAVDAPKNTEKLEVNDIYLMTKSESGYTDPNDKENISVPAMVQKRQVTKSFTPGEKCRINNSYLPNFVTKIAEHRLSAFCGTYSRDGKMLVTASQDSLLHFYDTSTDNFHELKTIFAQNVSWSILDTAFSPDGRHIAYSTWSDAIHLCPIYGDSSVQEALLLNPTLVGRFCVFSIVFTNDGREILGAANDGCLYFYDLEYHQTTIKIKAHSDHVNAVTFADNTSQILYSGSDDGLCKVWDKRTLNEAHPKPVGILAGHRNGLTYIDSRGDGRYLITNSKDQSIKLWDVRAFSGKKAQDNVRNAVANQKWDYRMHTHVPKKLHVKLTSNSTLEGDTSIMTYKGHVVTRTLIRCHFSPSASTGQRYIYTGCGNGRVIIYDLLTGEIVKKLEGHSAVVRDVHWHPYQQEIISSSWDGIIGCWRYHPFIKKISK